MVTSLPKFVLSLLLIPSSVGLLAVGAAGQKPPAAGVSKSAGARAPKPATASAPKPAVSDGPPITASPHKVFVDSVNNKLYWPMDKPFWVRLAASPDADAPSYLLQRVTPDSEINTDQYNKEGIALEIRNGQFIRWYNYVTKANTELEFFSDGDPPVTKTTCTGAPTSVIADKTYYGVGLRCSLASQDEVSGVDKVYVSVNNEAWKPYAGELILNKEMDVVLRAYATDKVGWAETPTAMRFTVDLSPPTTKHAIEGNAIGTVLSSQAKFGITSGDTLSGVASVNARFDKQDFKLVTDGQVAVDALPDGDHTLSYYSVDKVENKETEHVIPFYVDRTPPTAGAEVVGDLSVAPNGTRYVSSRSHVKLSAQDNKIGVDKIVYAFDDVTFQQYGDQFLLPARSGAAKLSYRASDKLNNTSTVAVLPYFMDLAPPQSAQHINGPSYQVRSDIYITNATHIELSSTDDASGVQKIEYRSEDAPEPQTYTAPLAFPNEGRRLLRYWGTDKVNNRELDRAVELITDNTPPDIFATFSLTPTTASNADGMPVYRPMTSLFLAATDRSSGVHKIYYSFNGGKEADYSTPLVLDHDGTFDLMVRAEDNLGNQSSKHVKFVVHE